MHFLSIMRRLAACATGAPIPTDGYNNAQLYGMFSQTAGYEATMIKDSPDNFNLPATGPPHGAATSRRPGLPWKSDHFDYVE